MRLTIYQELCQYIGALAGLKWVDWDLGQLMLPKESYPVPLPSVLISFGAFAYRDLSCGTQEGEATVYIDLYLRRAGDTQATSDKKEQTLQDLQLLDALYTALHNKFATEDTQAFLRRSEEPLNTNPDLIAVRQSYETRFLQQPTAALTQKKPLKKLDVSTQLPEKPLPLAKKTQSIAFLLPTEGSVGDSMALSATSSAGLPVLFSSSDEALALVSGNTLRLLAAGTVTIIASQAGNEEYQAVSVSRRLAISVALTETVEARGTWRFSSQGDGSPANRASRPAYGALRWEPPTTVGQDVALQCGAGDASGTENTAMFPSMATRPRHRFYAITNADGTYSFGQPASGERILRISGLGADNSADPNNYVDIVTGTDTNPAPNNFASTNKGNTDSVGAEGGYGNADLNTQTVHVWGRVKALQGSFAVNSDLLLQRILIT